MIKSPESIRVLRIIARLNVGGPSIHTALLSQGLSTRGYETLLVAGRVGDDEGDMSYYARSRGVTPLFLESLGREIDPLRDFRSLVSVLGLIRRFRPHILHTHTAKAGFIGRTAAILSGVPIVVHTFHGHVFHSYFSPFKTGMFLNIERQLASRSTAILTVGERQRSEILGYGIGDPRKVTSIPLGFDFDDLVTAPGGGDGLRKSLGIPDRAPLAGIVARLVPVKDHDLFLKSAAVAASICPELHFLVVGDGELRPQMESTIAELGLEDRVHFSGWRNDLGTVYSALDMAVLTSRNEGLPVTLIEALASGVPVVSTDVGGVRDIVDHGVTGFVASSRDPQEIGGHIAHLASDNELCLSFGRKGRRFARRAFSSERLVDDMDRLYRRLLSARGCPLPINGAEKAMPSLKEVR